MAENARELGLDYEPADGTQVSKVWWDGEKLMAKPIPLEDIYQPAPVQEPVPVFELQKSGWEIICDLDWIQTLPFGTKLYTTPPAAPDLQAELDATNRQVEILSNALAESRREVAALKAVQEPVAWMDASGDIYKHKLWPDWNPPHTPLYTTPPAAPTVQEPVAWREFDGEGGYTYFAYQDNETWRDEYIERNGEKYANWVEPLYTASSTSHLHLLSDEFIYKVVRSSQPHLDDDCADWRRHFAECKYWLEIAHGITTPPAAKRQWVGLTEKEILECRSANHLHFYLAIEAKLKEKNSD
jgi:hypothetical protein